MEKKYQYKHIFTLNDITSIKNIKNLHPLDNLKNKKIFIETLCKDLSITEYKDISNGKNNLFKILYNGIYYNLFIEFPDGGGTDISQNRTTKKIAIPFHLKSFKKLIENYERILVINIYIPLKENQMLDFEKRCYLIIDPKEIYSSNVIEKRTNNSSSRWIKLEDIIDIIKNKIYKLNNKKNVYIIHWEKIKWFFDNILQEEYIKMINSELTKINISDLNNENNKKYKKYRRLFRELLISERGPKCEIINCNINILELLIASHIKPVNKILSDNTLDNLQKITEISDINNGFLLCPNHDALFDKFLITFDFDGKLHILNNLKNCIQYFNLTEGIKNINILSKKSKKYLNFHKKEFESKIS